MTLASRPASTLSTFSRRTLTLRGLVRIMVPVVRRARAVVRAVRHSRLNGQLVERVMLAVTAVNGCRYCSWVHARAALHGGISWAEVRALLASQFAGVPSEEVPFLAFAQHYAESREHPTRQARVTLLRTVGLARAGDLLVLLQLITIGNLVGNTLDGFASRLQGRPPAGGSPAFELLLYALALPIAWLLKRLALPRLLPSS